MNIEQSILDWIKTTLSQRREFLGNLPPCPYAAEALLKGQVSIAPVASSEAFDFVVQSLKYFSPAKTKVQVIAVADWQNLSVAEVQDFVKKCRNEFYKNDLWLLYDHPASAEIVQDFSFNHGSLLLFFVQKLSDLMLASHELKKTSYYDQWPQDYKVQVLGLREEYYKKYLSLQAELLGTVHDA